ncbi:UDP-N-acetylglucosamine 1-carboxyvinyltransferase [Candidatus Roizmanbacteria bacterium]|nr:UDP-N-acetylglucosamine 1-carboxyvinyltransferase [Candidatus Roizmanbacteria bacterium]
MSKFIINGGKKLNGTIHVAGNKNAVLPIMAASLLIDEEVVLDNVPQIKDVAAMMTILRSLGATVEQPKPHMLIINTTSVDSYEVLPEYAKQLRASVLLLGPLYGRFGHVKLPHPGGDVIGKRNIDTHLDGFIHLGATVKTAHELYELSHKKTTDEVVIFLDEPSVTGTENLMMASVLGKGTVRLHNAAKEPHIVCLGEFLKKAGAKIVGLGTDNMVIEGVTKLSGIKHTVHPDYLEEGTFAVLAAASGSTFAITGGFHDEIRSPLHVLSHMGIRLNVNSDTLIVIPSELRACEKRVQAMPHPGFPTDLMSPFIVLGTQAKGEMLFHDPLYESRMFFVDKLIRMGAKITICDPHRVIVYGPTKLHGTYLNTPDIRAGIALVIAALIAEGESIIDNAEIIERGYERLDERLRALGADIIKHE